LGRLKKDEIDERDRTGSFGDGLLSTELLFGAVSKLGKTSAPVALCSRPNGSTTANSGGGGSVWVKVAGSALISALSAGGGAGERAIGAAEGAEEDAVEGTPIPPAAAAALAALAAVAAVDAGASAAAAACACSLLTGPVVLSSSMSVGYDSLRDSSTCRWA
jgi:hypothetical protein